MVATRYMVRDEAPPSECDAEPKRLTVRAIVLALSLVYYFRLSDRRDRVELSRRLETHMRRWPGPDSGCVAVAQIIDREQTWYTESMALEADIAPNEAVKENIFVMTVCILNRVPLFVVGKPGSSKSLAMTVVRNNLKAGRSPAPAWRGTDDVFLVPYQCSPLTQVGRIRACVLFSLV